MRNVTANSGQSKRFEQLDKALVVALDEYFHLMNGSKVNKLHKLVSMRIEKVLFEYMLEREHYNQSKACERLGISRSTLRTKLKKYRTKLPK